VSSAVKRYPWSARFPEDVIYLIKQLAKHDDSDGTKAVMRAVRDQAKRLRVR
jgi:hypothetical protein